MSACDLAALELLVGRWKGSSSEETWTRVGERLVAVAFSKDGGFEVLATDVVDGVPRYVARPSGGAPTPFACVASTPSSPGPSPGKAESLTFTNPEHDFPQRIRYTREGRRMEAGIGLLEGDDRAVFRWKAADREPVPEVEAADRAFAAAVADGGVDAWVAAFHPEGHKWHGDAMVTLDGMRTAMEPALTSGRLTWAPVASGRDPWDDDRAFTVGAWTFTGAEGTGSGWYVTVWRREGDRWLAWYDGGAPG